ncbi:hypothetical protein [Xanthobacter aminoxidans]|uniref:hypothetical protein n=1 Tax=Xanthobacter aminoxidans TaxID=186280 RepID=UPI002022DC2C|nr:hypothetical protein [Xanthobacter aminoxidans]MCL8385864.1 hypothetical protein [Xanthobacter aminoxidans]
MMRVPTKRERDALRHLSYGGAEGEPVANLFGAGEKTRQTLLDEGWAEELPPRLSGTKLMRITALGREALDSPEPEKEPSRRKLSTLPPRLKTINPADILKRKR